MSALVAADPDDDESDDQPSAANAAGAGGSATKAVGAGSGDWVVADLSGETVTLMAAEDCERMQDAKTASKQILSKLNELWEQVSAAAEDSEITAQLNAAGLVCRLIFQGKEYM